MQSGNQNINMEKSMKQEDNLQNKFTFRELRQLWRPLTDYINDAYVKDLSSLYRLELKKRWIHFYSKEDFTLEETLCIIEDYTVQKETPKKEEKEQKVELRSIMGH
jgi:hypothetical protein